MRITRNPVLDIATLTWVGNDGVEDYAGPVVYLKGGKKTLAAAQQNFFYETVRQQELMFGAQTELFNQIRAATEPILAKGPQQYGFTPEQDALLRGEITDAGARATANVVGATQLREQQRTGGASVLPTGAGAELEERARIVGAQETAGRLSAEKLAGFDAGNKLYAQALGALSGVAQLQDPSRYTSAAAGQGTAATSASAQQGSGIGGIIGSVLGGVGSAIIGKI